MRLPLTYGAAGPADLIGKIGVVTARCGLLLVIIIGLTSCKASGPARTCDEITGHGLPQMLQQTSSPDEIRKQIADVFGVPIEQVSLTPSTRITHLTWAKDGMQVTLGLEGMHPVGAGVHYSERPPSADAVIACLGAPDYYRSIYQLAPPGAPGNILIVYIYYVRRGISASFFQNQLGKSPPHVNGAMVLPDFGFAPVGSIEDTMNRLNPYLLEKQKDQIKPWPGNWQSLETVIDTDSPPR